MGKSLKHDVMHSDKTQCYRYIGSSSVKQYVYKSQSLCLWPLSKSRSWMLNLHTRFAQNVKYAEQSIFHRNIMYPLQNFTATISAFLHPPNIIYVYTNQQIIIEMHRFNNLEKMNHIVSHWWCNSIFWLSGYQNLRGNLLTESVCS